MKKLNKFFAVLVALAMMATLCVCMAFAADPDPDVGTPDNAFITKYLDKAEGVSDDTTFTFKAAKVSDSAKADTNSMPDAVDVSFKADKTPATTTGATDGSKYGNALVMKFFEGKTFDHAGVYTYRVTEDTTNLVDNETTGIDWTPSEESYLLKIYVTNVGGTPTPTSIGVQKESEQGAPKVDVKVDDPTENDNDGSDGIQTSGFSFTNKLNKVLKDTTDDGLLRVNKIIDGETADLTATFPFTINLTLPKNATDTTVTYYLNGTAKTANVAADKTVAISETLGNNGKIVFQVLPAGTTYTVNESIQNAQNKNKWTPKVEFTDDVADLTTTNGTAGEDLAAKSGTVKDTDAKNIAQYTNAYSDPDTTTPTGILINNLPYIALALVAIGGLVAYVVVRRRQSDEA